MSDPGKAKIATELFQTGTKALQSGNYDYSINCFQKCCKLLPDKLIYRQALRGAERKKYDNNGKGAAMAGLRSQLAKGKLQVAKTRQKWHDVLVVGEEILALNPWDVDVLCDMGHACKELELLDVGIWIVETAAETSKDRADVFRLLSQLYEAHKMFGKAIAALEKVTKLDPKDHDAASKMRQLAANETIQKSGFEDKKAEEAKKTGASPGSPVVAAGEMIKATAVQIDTYENRIKREIESLEARLEHEADNPNLYVQIGDNYKKIGEFDKAAAIFERGFQVTGGRDVDIKAKALECRIEPLRKNLDLLKENADKLEKAGSPEGIEKAKKMRLKAQATFGEILKREIELYQFRTEHNPNDYLAYYHLGCAQLRLKQFDDAIKSLQQGRNDPEHKWEALLYLGIAFKEKKNYVLAEKNLADALAAISEGNEAARKQILYYRGLVAEARGDVPSALNFYNEIAAIDYGYKDVAKRLDQLNAE